MKTRTRQGNSSPEDTQTNAARRPVTREQIEKRAHEIFVARGGKTGRDLDDWLQAERELKGRHNPSATN